MKVSGYFLALVGFPLAGFASDFMERVQERMGLYQAIEEQGIKEGLPRDGRLAELTGRQVAAVPDGDKDAVDYFFLGNMTFSVDDDLSYELMKKAESMEPDNPYIAYERALHEHRRGDCAAAVPYYEKLWASEVGREHYASRALAAECYLRTGKYEKAVTVWLEANHPSNHIGIEKAIHVVHGGQSPQGRRSDLYQAIRTGDRELLGDLMYLDANWKRDWWNIDVNKDYLEADLEFARELLGEESREYRELSLYRDIKIEAIENADVLPRMADLGLWGDGPRLASYPVINYEIWSHVLREKLVSEKDALARLEEPLRARALAEGARREDLDLLAYLYAVLDGTKLKEIDRLGWKRLGLKKYALSYIVGAEADGEGISELVDAALSDFPEDPMLLMARLQRNWDSPDRAKMMAAAVAAEFPNVAERKDSYRIKGYMYSLAKEIDHPAVRED